MNLRDYSNIRYFLSQCQQYEASYTKIFVNKVFKTPICKTGSLLGIALCKNHITQKSHHIKIASHKNKINLVIKMLVCLFPDQTEDDQIKTNLVIQMLLTLFN